MAVNQSGAGHAGVFVGPEGRLRPAGGFCLHGQRRVLSVLPDRDGSDEKPAGLRHPAVRGGKTPWRGQLVNKDEQ